MSKYDPGDKIAVSATVDRVFTNKRTGKTCMDIRLEGVLHTISEDVVLQGGHEKPPIKKGDIVATCQRLTSRPRYRVLCVEEDFAICKSLLHPHGAQMFHVSELTRIKE